MDLARGAGVGLIVLGTIILGSPVVATLATVTVLGVMILLGGVAEIVGPFWCREWSGFFLPCSRAPWESSSV